MPMTEPSAELKTRNVFIDTEAFDSANINFSSTTFSELTKLAKSGKIQVFLSSITLKEIDAHLVEKVNEAEAALKEFRSRARILHNLPNLPLHPVFQKFDEEKALDDLRKTLKTFLTDANVTVLDLKNVNPEEVFENYFGKAPPFGDGKNKDEFPDAFAVKAALTWCQHNNQRMYVVSMDKAIRLACSQTADLIPLRKLEEFLDLVTKHTQKEQSEKALSLYTQNFDRIAASISKEFESSGFYLADEDGDAENIVVTMISLKEPSLLEVDEDSASFSIPVRIEYKVDVSYADYGAGSYDHESNSWIYLPTKDETIEEHASFEAEVYLQIDTDDVPEPVFVDCTIPAEFRVTVQPTDYELK